MRVDHPVADTIQRVLPAAAIGAAATVAMATVVGDAGRPVAGAGAVATAMVDGALLPAADIIMLPAAAAVGTIIGPLLLPAVDIILRAAPPAAGTRICG